MGMAGPHEVLIEGSISSLFEITSEKETWGQVDVNKLQIVALTCKM